jgi:hypothetical protein
MPDMKPSKRDIEQAVRQRHGDMGIEQLDRGIKLEERQCEHRRRCHAIGQQPEEQVFVTEKPVARKSIGGGQRYGDRNDGIDDNVDQRVDVAVVPCGIGEYLDVIIQRELLREKREATENLVGGFE